MVQFGAGGAGAAVAHALMSHQVEQIHARAIPTWRKRRHWPNVLASASGAPYRRTATVGDAMRSADGIVNATPVGMAKYPGLPFARPLLKPEHWVAEIIYFPAETELLRAARALGCRTLAGTGMPVYQAVKAFELFTGLAPNRDRMVDHSGRLRDARLSRRFRSRARGRCRHLRGLRAWSWRPWRRGPWRA